MALICYNYNYRVVIIRLVVFMAIKSSNYKNINIKNRLLGFALIESILSVMVVSSMVSNTHELYLNKNKVNNILDNYKYTQSAVTEYYNKNGVLPTRNNSNINNQINIKSKQSSFVQDISVNQFGEIIITLSDNNNKTYTAINNKTIILEPELNTNGTIDWHCDQGSLEDKYRPDNCLLNNLKQFSEPNNFNLQQDNINHIHHPIPDEIIEFIENNNLI